MPTTAVSDEFFRAYGRVPKKAQKRVREFTRKFRQDPMSPGINYEKLSGEVDPQLRSVRVGIDYRAIVLAPKQGDVYVLLWVDHHDEAYRWAENRRVEVHPATGALQVFQTYEAVAPELPRAEQRAAASSGRFRDLSDEQLFAAGVPKVLVPAVREIYTDADFDALAPHLPAEAAEVLTGVAAGMTLDEALADVLAGLPSEKRPTEPIDTEDVAAALERVESTRRFRVLDEDFDLETALDHPLDTWRVFLHPTQRKLAEKATKGPTRVLGAAGTGKTVVAMHRAVNLVRHLLKPDERVLFTTFTVNLAADIQAQLAKIAAPEELERIQVVGLDALASRLAKEGGIEAQPAFDTEKLWLEAIDVYGEGPWGLELYRAEWQDVVQAQDIRDQATYLRARRHGRGTKLRRSERRKVWPVFARYRELLDERGLAEPADLLRVAKRVVDSAPEKHRYASVVVDETQDMSAPALELVRALAGPEHPNDLFLVGDAHQRIYGRPVPLLSCGINVRGRRSRRLRVNYRTTDTIRRFAMRVLEGESFDDLDEGTDEAEGYVSLRSGPNPHVEHLEDLAAERAFLVSELQRLVKEEHVPPAHICVAARTHEQIDKSYAPALSTAGVATEKLGRGRPQSDAVRLATMHRIKGLEFPVVFLVGVDRGHMPLPTPELRAPDPVVRAHAIKRERCLLYVAASRARDRLYVTASGKPSDFIG
jgi:mRNA-degrading endonuclease RelE of RelBE toxin-antitoxin system